jgi:pimeloyl-ACP methyl ester carboxylesterase
MNETIIHHENAILQYKSTGSGKTVLLIHGFAEDSEIWSDMAKSLEHEYTVIVPDLLGSGGSTGNTAGISMEKLADDIKIILDKENIGTCSMIGHSMGGYITLAFAEKYPERLNGFGLFHSTAYADSDEKKDARKKNIGFIKKNGSRKFLEQSVPKLFSPETNEKNKSLIKKIIDRYSNFSTHSLVHYTEAMMNRPERTEVLKNFPGPVLFIMGEFDSAVPLEQGLKQCQIPGISYIYICTHSGHMGMLEEPEFCLQAIRHFLSGK